MVTQALGGGADTVSRFVLRVRGEQDAELPRVFGRVSRSINRVNEELGTVQGSLRNQRMELRRLREGSEEYDRLATEISQTETEVSRLTNELDAQQRSWRRLNQVGRASRNVFLGVGAAIGVGVGALVLQTDRVGQMAAELRAISLETGIATDELQRLQLQVRATGGELDIDELRELNIRLGEAAVAGTGTAAEALELLGFNARQVSSRDLPELLTAIEALESREQRQFFADEIFGGQFAERVIPTFDLDPESRAALQEVNVLTETQIEQFARSRIQLQALQAEFSQAAAGIGGAFLPIMTDLLETVQPIVAAFGQWAEENPMIIRTLAGVAAGVAVITGAVWLLNTALAIRAALQGPTGWVALGLAATLGLGIAGFAIANARSGNDTLEDTEATQQEVVRAGTYQGVMQANIEERSELANSLVNILPTCPGDSFEPAPTNQQPEVSPEQTAALAPFTAAFGDVPFRERDSIFGPARVPFDTPAPEGVFDASTARADSGRFVDSLTEQELSDLFNDSRGNPRQIVEGDTNVTINQTNTVEIPEELEERVADLRASLERLTAGR